MNIKRWAIGVTVATLILGNAFAASAQTTTTSAASLQALIQTLQEQIKSLTTQLEAIKKAQQQVSSTSGDIKDTLKLIKQLREGMTGDDVKLLQAVLAADDDIYPEGIVSGYYGRLTAQAVKRFQKKHDLDQVGNVGPKTLEKITKELEKNPITTEVRNGVKGLCAIVPPGHLIAPGWLKKNNGSLVVIPACQTIPEGIAKKLGLATSTPPTTTPDVTAPVISDLEIKDIAANSAKIEWETNEPTVGTIHYGTTNPLVISSAASVMQATQLSKEHEFRLTGLASNTTYYVIVSAKDAAGNVTTASQRSFTTATGADVTAPNLSNIAADMTTASSTRIVWTTNEAATSKVWYGTSTPFSAAVATLASSDASVTGHAVTLTGLASNTIYYYIVASTDAAGNTATSGVSMVTTMSVDTTAPVISGLSATSTTATSSTIVWNTNEQATSKVWYGTTSPVTANAPMALLTVPATTHSVVATGLASGTVYYYVVASTDAAGNTATSSESTFQTLSQSSY